MESFLEIEIILNIIENTSEITKEHNVDNEQIAYYRNNIRKNIFFLQEELLEKYSETICKYVVFPILAYVDEKLMLLKEQSGSSISWSLLQLEYYDRKNGGEYVFEIIDNLLSDNIYPQICYQTMSIILHNDFYGKYYENIYNHSFLTYKKEVDKYLDKLSETDLNNFIDISVNSSPPLRRYHKIIKILLIISVPVGLFAISLLIFLS
ncbi:developmental protein [Francisella persica ATCC VR-331]|uniref:Developmental protein n=1 Tax=Francisella persica ATCC VR-331 TaxID=1086726 RepID=A0AAC8VD03_9GAMM|nr:DotU family type IV/VI secretion system protein [Francisella persica]ALB01434.1 developmental protein [Francisella persica ATCC VR-331]ANH77724.1 developmental protein [Francisella persica ATCC VR-331]